MGVGSRSQQGSVGRLAWVGVLAVAGLILGGVAVGASAPTVPGAPTITSVTPGDHNIRVVFTRPARNGGAPITSYRATCTSTNGGSTRSESNDHSPILVDELSAGKTYTCTVMARNRIGFGPPSAPSSAVVVLPVPPGAPTITSVSGGDHSVRVRFTKPASNGGSPIFTYKATCTSSNGGHAGSDSDFSLNILVQGLTPSKTYTCTVMAKNVAGFGPPSAASGPVVALPIVAGAPTITSVTPGVESMTVAFTAPSTGTGIFDYQASCSSSDGGVTRSNDHGSSPIVVGDLTSAKTYTCIVMAQNSFGFGPPSTASAPQMTIGAPGAPSVTSVTAGSRSITVAFTPPASDGGSSIINYRATCISSDGGISRTRDGAVSPVIVANLSPANTYTCTVMARNVAGFGPPSTPSTSVITQT